LARANLWFKKARGADQIGANPHAGPSSRFGVLKFPESISTVYIILHISSKDELIFLKKKKARQNLVNVVIFQTQLSQTLRISNMAQTAFFGMSLPIIQAL